MLLNVNATRMELLHLKKRLVLARRGHKLLRDKQDELMRFIQELVKVIKDLREEVEKELSSAIKRFLFVRASMDPNDIEEAFLMPKMQFTLEMDVKNIMNVKVPVFEKKVEGEAICYGYATTSPEMDLVLLSIEKIFEKLIDLSEKEKRLELLAQEMEKTRRRVNALEYILIPNLEETTKYIYMKLSEMERANITRLMRIKDVIRKG